MLTFTLAVMLGAMDPSTARSWSPAAIPADTLQQTNVKDELTKKLDALSKADHAIFHDDVTSIVTPYFPRGQSFAETERVLQAQKLGPLRHFHGKGERADNTIYVSHTDLASEIFSDVFVVIDFEFDGKAEHDMRLKKVSAFLQASSM